MLRSPLTPALSLGEREKLFSPGMQIGCVGLLESWRNSSLSPRERAG